MKAVFVEQPGGVENLKYADLPKPSPGPGQALVKIAASGVNYIDIYFRKGVYPAPPPIVLGSEGAGTVEAVAPDVKNVALGDRVAYAMARGSYAEYAVVPAWQLVKIPASVDFEHRRRRDAARHDRALSHPLHVSAEAGRFVPYPRRRRRHRAIDCPDGEDAGRASHRNRRR